MVVTRNGLIIEQDELNLSGKSAITGSKPIIVPYKYFDRIKANKIIYDATDSRTVDEVIKHHKENALYLPYAKKMPSGYMTESIKENKDAKDSWLMEVDRHERIKMTHCYKVLTLIVNRAVIYTGQPILGAIVDWDFSDEAMVERLRVLDNKYGIIDNIKYYTIKLNRRRYIQGGCIQAKELAEFSDRLWEKDMILVEFRFTDNKIIKVASRANDRWDDLEKLVEALRI